MAPHLQNAAVFLIQTLFNLYLLILLLRLVLQYLRVDYYNPLTQFIVKITNPVVVPLRRIIPGYWGIDFATILVILLLSLIKVCMLSLISFSRFPAVSGLILWTLGDIITLTINLFFYAVLLNVIISWVAPLSHSPVTAILYRLTDPIMRPARRVIPPIGGIDITPIPVLIGLQLLKFLIANPLMQAGFQYAVA